MENLSNYSPSIIYIFLAIPLLYSQLSYRYIISIGFIFHLIFVIVWSYFLYFLCKYGFANIAWILCILPYVFGYFILRILLEQAISNPSILLSINTSDM